MHKLAKGLKKKKKQKKGKKGTEEDEFGPEELERYRRERAEAHHNFTEEKPEKSTGSTTSDEWRKFEALTAGVDSILKKSQGDLDRIKSTSFFQRKVPVEERRRENKKETESDKNQSKKWVGFDKDGNPIEEHQDNGVTNYSLVVNGGGFANTSDYEDEQDDSYEDDIFDTTYVDVLQNTEVRLAYIPDSPIEEDEGEDPFDTTRAEKVLKTVDKKGKKLVSIGNAVEVLAGRIDYVSTCKLRTTEQPKVQDLLLDDDVILGIEGVVEIDTNHLERNKTLLDDDSDVREITTNITESPIIQPIISTTIEDVDDSSRTELKIPLDISEFEELKGKTILEEIPDLDDSEFDVNNLADRDIVIQESDDPFGTKELESAEFENGIVEASFEVATFVNEEDPFDTTFADNILPSRIELKFIERELQELHETTESIPPSNPTVLDRDHKSGSFEKEVITIPRIPSKSRNKDLLASSTTDLTQLTDQPIQLPEEINYIDPFDTSCVQELAPGRTELKFLEQELLGRNTNVHGSLEDDDFDPRKEDSLLKSEAFAIQQVLENVEPIPDGVNEVNQVDKNPETSGHFCKISGLDVLKTAQSRVVAFELPTTSDRLDLLSTSKEEDEVSSKPLTPYYCQKSLGEIIPFGEQPEQEVDPFDTSFVTEVVPSKTELKLIESELLRTEARQPDNTFQRSSGEKEETKYIKPVLNERAAVIRKQESILDTVIEVGIRPLTPEVEIRTVEEEEILYVDPFDTSIATNILPGKIELKLIENELSKISERAPVNSIPIDFETGKITTGFDGSASNSNLHQKEKSEDLLCSDGNDPGDKILTPLQDKQLITAEKIDPFDTSLVTVEFGKAELKLLDSELRN